MPDCVPSGSGLVLCSIIQHLSLAFTLGSPLCLAFSLVIWDVTMAVGRQRGALEWGQQMIRPGKGGCHLWHNHHHQHDDHHHQHQLATLPTQLYARPELFP